MNPEYSSDHYFAAFSIQRRVIGALILRELHTRFGRHNIGFLWMMVEPMLLGIGITLAHVYGFSLPLPYGLDAQAFWITGYVPWVMFRSIVLRSAAAIESNRTLLYHRIVTILDIHLARAILDGLAVTFCLVFLIVILAGLGYSTLPQRPLLMFAGMAMLWWLALGIGLIYSAWAQVSHLAEKIMEPAMYLVLPLSGVFFLLSWLPGTFRTTALWVPMPHIIEMIREGQFRSLNDPEVSLVYPLAWCLITTLVGMAWIRLIRKRVEL